MGVERGTVRVKCLAQEHDAMTSTTARTRRVRSRVRRINYKPPRLYKKLLFYYEQFGCEEVLTYPNPPGKITVNAQNNYVLFKCSWIKRKHLMCEYLKLYLYQGPVLLGQAGGQLTTVVKNSTRISEI